MLAAVVDGPQSGAVDGGSADLHKRAEVTSRTPEFIAGEASKPFGWDPAHFLEWATIQRMLAAIAPAPRRRRDRRRLRVGMDLPVPGRIGSMTSSATTWCRPTSSSRGRAPSDGALRPGSRSPTWNVYRQATPPMRPCCSTRCTIRGRQRTALHSIAARLTPGGWLLIGEPTWLHRFSPAARAAHHRHGWMERRTEPPNADA